MPAGPVDQRILIDPADPGCVRTQRGAGGRWQCRCDLGEVFKNPRAGPVEIGSVLEDDIDETVIEERVPADRDRAGHGQHGRRQRIGHLVFHDLGRLARIGGLDNDLNIGEVRNGIQGRLFKGVPAPDGQECGEQEDQDPVPDGPADKTCNHCASTRAGEILRMSERT